MELAERLKSPGPKRILALDGGGIRGNITVGFLERMEAVLRERHNNPELRLCDYFDLIAGTSTGSLVSGMLGVGFTVAKLKGFYLNLAARAFGRKRWWQAMLKGIWRAKYDVKPLEDLLTELFGDRTLGDPTLPTALCLVTKRADSGSTWPLINHPDGKYFKYNKDIELRQAVRAAGAAPTIFDPAVLDIGGGKMRPFIDGAISTANNPALQAFYVATLHGFPFRWPVGEDELLLASVGTGTWERISKWDFMVDYKGYKWAEEIPDQMIEDTNWGNQVLLQYLSRTPTPWYIDGEIEGLEHDVLHAKPALTYLRYNAWLEKEPLEAVGLPQTDEEVESLRDMTKGENAETLFEIGSTVARSEVDLVKKRSYPIRSEHFPECFDVEALKR